jgi:dienelactone hydrolase
MTVIERVVLLTAAAALILRAPGIEAQQAVTLVTVIAAFVSVVHTVVSHVRWQMFPVYLVVVLMLFALVWGRAPAGPAMYLAIGGGLALLVLAAVLAAGMPVRSLPEPDGPFGVGTISVTHRRVDDRAGHGPAACRELLIKVWYPAAASGTTLHAETLWYEFQDRSAFPLVIRLLTRYLKAVSTHSHPGAPLRAAGASCPIVVYNHGLVSIASENTLLMESLASNGYIVLSVRHMGQKAEYDRVNAATSQAAAQQVSALNDRLRQDISRDERARVSLQLYQQNAAMGQIVGGRRADTEHVLDSIDAIVRRIPGWQSADRGPRTRVAVVGLSLGGAVATELSKADARCVAAVNMDGGLYGDRVLEPIRVPYLMLYSEMNTGSNDAARDAALVSFEEAPAPGTRHMDFHDAAVVLPGLRWLGVLGRIGENRVNTVKNTHIRQFLAHHLTTADQVTR